MPTITLHKTELEKLLGKKLPVEELKDRISMLGTDLEGIEGDLITVEIFPNRPDLLSEYGFARALRSFLGIQTGLLSYSVKKSGYKVLIDSSVTMRPYTVCAIVRNIKFSDEKLRDIIQMQEKLAKTHGRDRKKSGYGIYPLKGISFPVSYIAKDPATIYFRPLGFSSEICAKDVEELHPRGKDYKHITKDWKKFPFFIDAKGAILSMLPYTNSEDTGKVNVSTTEVFIECSGTDLKNVELALNMFSCMFADMGAEVYSVEMIYPDKTITTPNLEPSRMKLDVAYANARLGLSLSAEEIGKLLAKMGFSYKNSEVLIPAYRADILHPVDFVEDIAIAYGYENFSATIPSVATVGCEDPYEHFATKVRELLVGFGLLELKNYHLSTVDDLNTKMGLQESLVSLKNAIGEHNQLRSFLLPSVLRTLKENQHNEYPHNVFEIGRVFGFSKDTETGILEQEHLCVAVCHEEADFTKIRQILDAFFRSLGLTHQVKEGVHSSFIEGRVGDIFLGSINVGRIGEVHPQVLTNWQLFMPVVSLELNLNLIFAEVEKSLN